MKGRHVAFGDGRTGERLPTGFDNVSAIYRSGLGVAGNLDANKISQLGSQPRYVRSVISPVPATGGADPESANESRVNAPNSVPTFGRIVSLQDFEDFARSFAGIAKAHVSLLYLGDAKAVHVTIAGENGMQVAADSQLYVDLVKAMNRVRDPFQRLLVASYEKRHFDVYAKVRVHPDYDSEIVIKAAEQALRETFSFDRRGFVQGVTVSEVTAALQRVEGVEAVDLDALSSSHEAKLRQLKSPFVIKSPFVKKRLYTKYSSS